MKTFKAYKKNHTSHRHLTNAFESLQEQQQQQQQPYILTDAMNAEIYTQSTSREIMVNLGIVNDTEANQSKLIHRQLTKTATNILPLMMTSSSPSLLSSLLLTSSSSSSSSEAVALTKSALSGESNKLKEMPRNQRCHLKNTDKQMFTMNPASLSTDISCQKTNSTPPSSLTLSSLPAPSPLTITSFAYDEVDLVRATATSKALASTTTSATTNSSSYYNTVSLLSSFLTSFSTFSKRKKPNAAFFFTHRHLASNSKTAVTWLLSLLCLVALFGCAHAGFACLSNPCVFGVCIDGLNSSYSCYCIDGYTGIQCQTNWDECWSGPCQNGGTCIDGVAYYNCTCPDGFSGTDCEENVDECMSNPCQNGGHCRDRNNGYTCTCQPGYLGDHCEIDVAVCETGTGARCHNGGECIEGPGLEFSCECAPGWHGRICQDEINECDSAPCQNGGVCVDKLASYVCACPMGYTGTNCEEEILICADNPCQNNALCLMEEGVPTCYCVPDYHGEKCEFQYDECQLGPRCMNGGVCIDGVDTFSCSCPPLLTGMLCECLMIGEDSLDCNYTAPSTQATPVYSKPKYMPTTPVTAIYSKPKYLPTTPAFPMYTKPKWVSEITTAKTYVTTMFLGEDDISSEITKSSEQATSEDGESLEKPITTGQSSEETISSTKKTYISSPGWGGDISPVITEPPGSYQSGSKDSGEVTHSSEVSGSVEITGSDEFTTIARFDESSESAEITTVKPVSISGDLDYTSRSKSGEFLPGSKEYPGKEALDVFEQPPTKTSYVPSVITTSIDTTYRGIDYSKPTRPSWVAPPTYYPTLTTSHATSKPESDSHFSTTYFTTIEEHSGVGPTKTIPIIRPGMPTTTTAPFFTDYPEVVITTKYYDFGHKEKDKEIGITPRPHIPTYSVTTIGTVHDYEGPAITTTAPGISITVYSPENRTYPHHYTTPYQPLTTTTSTVKTYHETTTPYYHPSPTLTAGTIKPGYHSEIAVTTASPQHLYTEDLITQRIPASIPEVGISAKPDFPEIATEYHHTVVTYGPPATYKPTMRPTSPSLTKMPTILPPKPTLLPQPTLPPTTPPTPVTLAPQPALPAQPTLLPPPVTLLPPQPTYPPPVYSTHQTVSVKIPTAVEEVASEEEDSANTVSPLIPGGGGIGGVSHTGGAGPIDADSQADCIKMGCYNGGTCVTTSEGSRCVCRFDRQGALCETPIIIKNAAFSGDSYVSHRIHKDIQHHDSLDTVLPMHVQLKVRTRATNGLIMLAAAQGTKGGHYMALFLQKGLLQFQFSCGLQTMLLSELETPVNTGHEITIRAELDFSRNYTHCNASLLVNDTLAMSGDQPTWLKLLPSRMHSPEAILNTWLHLGGAPQAPIGLIIELPPSQSGSGFTGCLHSLRINEETREIFGEALDGFGITECGSLACLSSPCRNGAACIKIETNEVDENGDKVEKWKCKCPTGYMGPTCEVSVCEDNPCQYGGTCVQFPGSGYLCLCPLGKHGHYCEHNLEVALPSFSGSVNGLSSFVAYTVPIPLEYSLELSFKILPQTMSQIALLAFLGQTGYHDEKSDHLAISFIQGYIMLTWNLGAGPRRIFTQKPIDFRLDAPRVPYEIKVGRIGRQAWLSVDGKFNITGRSPGSVSRMDVMPILYLGGHEIANFHTLPHDLPLHSGFQGCIYDVHLKAGQVTVPLQETRGVRGRGVGQCGTRECHRHACQHDGACLQHGATFTCICQEGWYGPLCAQPTNPCDSFNNKCSDDSTCVPLVNGYECDCPVGKTGKNCEEAIHSLSDVSLTGRRSYLAVRWPYFYENSDKLGSKRSQMISYRNFTKKLMPPKPISSANQHFVMKLLNEVEKQRSFSPVPLKTYEEHHRVQFFFIEFQLRPLSERGLLLYFGTLNNNQDKKIGFVSLSLQGGVVEFRISGPNSHVTVVRSVRMLAIGEWHKIKMAQRGRWLTLWVEGSASSALAPTAEVLVEPDSLLYIGGLKDLSKLPHNAISGFPIPFRGCVRGLVVSGSRIVLNETNIMESRNIRDCDGTACGGDSCEAGGHCWLDEKLQPHCICPEYAKGNRCEYSETCKLIPCKNNGRCLRSGRCSCPNGWGGFYCEIALGKPTTPSFRGNSYLVLPPQRIPMKDKRKGPSLYIRPREALQISLNFSTIEPDGLLLWSEHDNTKFLGLGLEDGHLKLASNLLGSINDTVSAPSSGFIADGSWHTAKIIVDRGLLELQLDGEVVFSEKLALAESLMPSSTTTSTTPSPYRTRTRSSLALRRGKQPTITYENTFYLGGFPNLDPVNKRTQGRFELPFKGCLQDIQFGAEPNTLIKDFSTYQGENIGSCDLHGDEPIVV